MSYFDFCPHPLEDKWADRPAIEMFTPYIHDGVERLDPEGADSGDEYVTLHCCSCIETAIAPLKELL